MGYSWTLSGLFWLFENTAFLHNVDLLFDSEGPVQACGGLPVAGAGVTWPCRDRSVFVFPELPESAVWNTLHVDLLSMC